MRTAYARVGGSRPAPRGLQKVLFEDQIQSIIKRETSRADRTGRQFSVVLFGVKQGRQWSVSTCRMARVLLKRVRQTDDVGWFDAGHLCVILPDTPVTGARVFAARTCDEIARRQPRPASMVYGYPGVPLNGEDGDDATVDIAGIERIPVHAHVNGGTEKVHAARNGNGHSNGNGHGRRNGHGNGHSTGHGNGHGNGHSHGHGNGHTPSVASIAAGLALAEAPEEGRGLAAGEREQLVEYFLDGVSSAIKQPQATKPDAALEELFVQPMPLWKRVLDLVGATFGLLILAPVLLAAAAAIRLTSPGPAIFKQKRTGLGGRPFTIYKFRTMCVDAERQQAALRKFNEQDGPAFKLTRDPRVTRIGQLLRKTSIDELPQLFNVLKGDMSLVGPRPLPIKEQDGCEQWQRHRLNVTPGLTCIWQVDGRSEVTFDEWVRMDVAYMKQRSLWSDLSILFRTVPSVLLRKGAK